MEEWKNLTDGSFKGVQFHVAIARASGGNHGVVREEVATERRLQLVQRPLVDGAAVRDFGRGPEIYTAEICFFGPTYVEDFSAFKAVLNQGTPGVLILPDLPKAVNASFQRMTEIAETGSGMSKTVRVIWVETNLQGEEIRKEALSTAGLSVVESKSAIDQAVSSTLSALNGNPVIAGVKAVESGLSQARRLANTVLTLEQGVRHRIIQLEANVKGTLNLVKQATDDIASIFGGKAKPSTVRKDLGTDAVTGQKIADYSDPETAPKAADPLAKPDAAPQIDLPTRNLGSAAGAKLFLSRANAILSSHRDELSGLAQGRVGDVSDAMSSTIQSLQNLSNAIGSQDVRVIVPFEMSLLEVLFFNGVQLDQLAAVHQKNRSIDDVLLIPKGTVVTL
jgi:GTP:adenosylcobinamide-phosphate guanylyltransferase